MSEKEDTAFLTHLAVNKKSCRFHSEPGFIGHLFLYQKALNQKLEWLDDVVRRNRDRPRLFAKICRN